MSNKTPKGLIAVEAALILPIILVLTFGALEYGWFFLKAQDTTNAARQGARVACRPDAALGDVLTAISALMNAADMGGSGYVVTVTPGAIGEMEAGEMLTVEIVVPYRGSLEFIGVPLIPVPESIRASVTMAKEGP